MRLFQGGIRGSARTHGRERLGALNLPTAPIFRWLDGLEDDRTAVQVGNSDSQLFLEFLT